MDTKYPRMLCIRGIPFHLMCWFTLFGKSFVKIMEKASPIQGEAFSTADELEFTISYKARDMVCLLMFYLFNQKRYSTNN